MRVHVEHDLLLINESVPGDLINFGGDAAGSGVSLMSGRRSLFLPADRTRRHPLVPSLSSYSPSSSSDRRLACNHEDSVTHFMIPENENGKRENLSLPPHLLPQTLTQP